MALNQSDNYVTTLLEHSSDAQNNLYYVKFTGGTLPTDETLTIRCSGFSLPETSQETYSVRFMNAYVNRPKPKVSLERTFTFSFRIDSQYDIYKTLLKQEKKTFDPYVGYTSSSISDKAENNDLFMVTVYLAKEGGDSTNTGNTSTFAEAFVFKNCWISSVSNVAFKHTSSDPLIAEVTVNYVYFEDKLNDATNSAFSPKGIGEPTQSSGGSTGPETDERM